MILTLLFLAVATVNSVAVYAQRKFKFYTRLFGKHDWGAHVLLLTIIWIAFLFAIILLQPPDWTLPNKLRLPGIVAAAIGLWLVFESWIRLGTAGVCNGWFFGRGPTKQLTGGVFRLRNPMYTGFALLFVGAGFWLENAAYLWLSAVSFVLLNLIQARIEDPNTKSPPTKRVNTYGVSASLPKVVFMLIFTGIVMVLLLVSSFRDSLDMEHHRNMGSMDMQASANPAMRHRFALLAVAHTDVCRDIGDKPAMDRYMSSLPKGARLQGSCCSAMDMKNYVSQISGLKKYTDIPQTPKDPYDVSVESAKQMLGFYDDIQLTPSQQGIYDKAQSMTDDKGWCCCQCWAWYTHAGLAKFLITQHSYSSRQVAEVMDLEDCCGGAS